MLKKEQYTKRKKAKKDNKTQKAIFTDGKISSSGELDKAVMDNFGKCTAMKYFVEEDEDE